MENKLSKEETGKGNNIMSIIECPRDAMQGWNQFIPTAKKIDYINSLLRIGFNTIDFGSFVSAKAIPQMADTREVLIGLDLGEGYTKLLAIIGNFRGAEEAVSYDSISYLGFPFSISETFQIRNTNSTIAKSFSTVEEIQNICIKKQKKLVVYLSMAFGNPFGDPYNSEILLGWAEKMAAMKIEIISLADTVGLATPNQISLALNTLMPKYPGINFGVHLHTTQENKKEKLEAAFNAGCKRIDGALKGVGGCPMAGNNLVGNMSTEFIIAYLEEKKMNIQLNKNALAYSLQLANEIFS